MPQKAGPRCSIAPCLRRSYRMSKKRLRNRLEDLFSNLAGEGSLSTEQGLPGQVNPPSGEPTELDESTPQPAAQATAALAVIPATTQTPPNHLAGWAWEIDANYNYISCGLEVSDALRM